ncbi:MAG: SusD/RagB family nutrient-binding outer membrane lipoprotein, partial [Bacteroidales bacterium]
GYTMWRRMDYPVFNIPSLVTTYDEIPIRFPYPVSEQTLNKASYTAAASAIGGDLISTPVFWDID